MTHVNIVKMPGVTDPSRIVDALLSNQPRAMPDGYILIAPINKDTKGPLCDAIDRLKDRRHNPQPILIGVVEDMSMVKPVSEAFSTTLLVGSGNEPKVEELLRFSELLIENPLILGTVGSALVYDVPVDGIPRQDPNLEQKLASMKGESLHSVARVPYPDTYAIAAPGDYIDPARRAIGQQASILGTVAANENRIHVAGFNFDEEGIEELVAEARPQPDLDKKESATEMAANSVNNGSESGSSQATRSSRSYETLHTEL